MSGTGLILFAHGARDPEWAAPFVRIRSLVAASRPALAVELAFLEIMTPSLADAVQRMAIDGIEDITVAPLFMAQGGHLKRDVPHLLDGIREHHPGLELRLLPPIGEVDDILDAIGAWLVASITQTH